MSSKESLSLHSKIKLNNGVYMPIFGLGNFMYSLCSECKNRILFYYNQQRHI